MINWEESGTGDPLIFVHGITEDLASWDPVIPLLEDRYRCVRLDLRGHGGYSSASISPAAKRRCRSASGVSVSGPGADPRRGLFHRARLAISQMTRPQNTIIPTPENNQAHQCDPPLLQYHIMS